MPVQKLKCPYCQTEIPLNQELCGRKVRCPQCSREWSVTAVKQNQTDSSANPLPAKPGSQTSQKVSEDSSANKRLQRVGRQMGDAQNEEEPKESNALKVWEPGDKLLGGKYEVRKLAPGVPHAEGGVGIVHRVYHIEWDLDFAVKSPKSEFIQSESGKLSFEQECQTWIELGLHTNIVTCYLVRRIGGIPRVFAEYVGDGTLRDWIGDGRLYEGTKQEALARILDIAIQFAWGLDHAHRQGLVHLDVKPGNVMMSGTTAKVTDFGLAKALQSENGSGEGTLSAAFCDGMTPSYCSPEQYDAFLKFKSGDSQSTKSKLAALAKSSSSQSKSSSSSASSGEEKTNEDSSSDSSDKKITKQSDIWSWAISVLAMFHGRSPCKKGGQTAAEVFEVFLKSKPSGNRPAVPEEMIPIFRHCFQKSPQDRPESMDQVADSLIEIYEKVIGTKFPRPKPANTAFTAEVFCNRAVSMLDLGKPVEAVKWIRRSASMSFWHPQITFDQTMIEWRFGLISDLQALEKLEELAKHNNSDPCSLYALGLLQKERGNPKGAFTALESAYELDPNRPEIQKALRLCKKAMPFESRSVGRFSTAAGQQIFTDAKQRFILLYMGEKNYSLIDSISGRPLQNFKQCVKNPEKPNLIALSEDFQQELYMAPERKILLKTRCEKDQTSSINQENDSIFAPEELLSLLPWGKKQNAFDRAESIRLTVNGNEIEVFDELSGEQTLKLSGHREDVTSVYLTPDGKWGVSGSFDGMMKVWNISTGRCIRTYRGLPGSVDAIWMDDAHRYVLTLVHGNSIQIWNTDLLCNKPKLTVAPMMICLVNNAETISKKQSELEALVAEAKKGTAQKDYARTLEFLQKASQIDGWQNVRSELNFPNLIGRHAQATDVADIVTLSNFQAHEESISSIALSYDGSRVVSAGKDQILRLWNIPQGECLRELEGHYDWIRSVDLTIDGRYAVSGSWDRSVRLWNLANGTEIRKFAEPIRNISCVKIAPDGRTIAVAAGNEITLWNGNNGKKLNGAFHGQGAIHSIQFSRDGLFLLSGGEDGVMTIWDARRLVPLRDCGGFQNEILSVMISPDEKWGIGGEAGGDILLFDLEADPKKPPKRLKGHMGNVNSLIFLSDNKRFLSAGKDKAIKFWTLPDGTLEKTIEGNSAAVTAIAADVTRSILVSAGEDASLKIRKLYWNYDYPGTIPPTKDIKRMIRVILYHHRRMAEINVKKRIPAEFYTSSGKSNHFDEKFRPDDKLKSRILTEMEYRGFGNVPREILLRALRDALDD